MHSWQMQEWVDFDCCVKVRATFRFWLRPFHLLGESPFSGGQGKQVNWSWAVRDSPAFLSLSFLECADISGIWDRLSPVPGTGRHRVPHHSSGHTGLHSNTAIHTRCSLVRQLNYQFNMTILYKSHLHVVFWFPLHRPQNRPKNTFFF